MENHDYTLPVGQVRLLMADLEPLEDPRNLATHPAYIFSDEQIEGFLTIEKGNVKRAAADALLAIAVSEALILKVLKTDDKQTDGAKLGAELRQQAKALRDQAASEEVRELDFNVVGFVPRPSDWAWR